jgi:opacity protein-like surface antigen
MQRFTRLVLLIASAAGVIATAPALAADLPARSGAVAPPPVAQTPWATQGFYFGGRQMLGATGETRFETAGGGSRFDSRYEFGRYTGAAIGYSFGPMMGAFRPRVELEGSFGTLAVDRHKITTAGVTQTADRTDSFGELRTTTGLVNAFADINLGALTGARPDSLLWRITPYLGAGIGASQVTLRRQGISGTGVVMDGSDTRMTWQVSAGIGYQIFERTTFDIGFRHQRTEGLQFTARDGTASKTELVNNLVTIGIRRQF